MPYSTILFDADNTLFDFDKAERHAFFQSFQDAGLPRSEEDYQAYRIINTERWRQYEARAITLPELLSGRFQDYFAAAGIRGTDPVSFGGSYLDYMAQGAFLMDGAAEVCKALDGRMAIITNGLTRSQRGRLSNSSIKDYIPHVFISEELGVSKPDVRYFEHVLNTLNIAPSEALVVGDSLTADIQGGINAGIDTCWYNPRSLVNTSGLTPTYEIAHLTDLLTLDGVSV